MYRSPFNSAGIKLILNDMNEKALGIDIDKCVYLASLASNPLVLDPTLDKLRAITTALTGRPEAPVSDQTAKELQLLQLQIREFLINDERLRLFTAQSLDEMLFDHVEGRGTINKLRRSLVIIFIVAVSLPLSTLALTTKLIVSLRANIAVSLFLALLYIGGAWLMLSALRWFKVELRTAYFWICTGMALIGLSLLLAPITLLLRLEHATWFKLGGTTVPFVVASVLLYIGVRQMAHLVGIASRALSVLLLIGVTVASLIVTLLIPYPGTPTAAHQIMVANGLLAIIVALNTFSMVLMGKIAHQIAPLYKKSMKWLFAVFAISTFSNMGEVILTSLGLIDLFGSILGLTFVVSALCALKAGYEFNRTIR